jgi:hypothetical protein
LLSTLLLTGWRTGIQQKALVLRGLTIIDITGGPPKPDMTVVITANGMTGIRQMFGDSDLLRWRDEVAKGSLQEPRMIVASPIIDGPQPVWPNSISARNEAEGRKAVTRVKQWGADFVKV